MRVRGLCQPAGGLPIVPRSGSNNASLYLNPSGTVYAIHKTKSLPSSSPLAPPYPPPSPKDRRSRLLEASRVFARHLDGRRPVSVGPLLVVGDRRLLCRRMPHRVRHRLLQCGSSELASLMRKVMNELRKSLGAKGTPACRLNTACTTLVQHLSSTGCAWSTPPRALPSTNT